jgi:peptidoglycan hydrolase-like protein with peptidoglycan-binding domain
VLLVLVPVAAYMAGRRAETPAESIANATPPPASPLVFVVEERTLSADEVFRGQIVSDVRQIAIQLPTPAVVTAPPPDLGSQLGDGSVIAEIDDRPVILLQGVLPLIRPVMPGDTGSVVRQIQESLQRLGHYAGDVDGVYDSDTQDAVSALYEELGYPAPVATDTAGTPVPMSEVVFLPAMPVSLRSTPLELGSVLAGEALVAEVHSQAPYVTVQVREPDRAYLQVETGVLLRSDSGDSLGTGTVVRADTAGQGDAGQGGADWVVLIEPDHGLDPDLIGSGLQVVVDGGSETGLVVPVTAIRADATGELYVLAVGDDGMPTRVAVSAGLAFGGFVIVEGTLAAGDSVIVAS